MKCSDLQTNLSLYADGLLGDAESLAIKGHLEICPLCRQKLTEYGEVRGFLRQMRRPEISASFSNSLKAGIRDERESNLGWLPIPIDILEWLQMKVMPYGVGVCVSVLATFAFLTMMASGMLQPEVEIARGDSVFLITNTETSDIGSGEISPLEFAQTRMAYSNESPSVNPQGALIALTKSLVRGGMKDDEVVVVADVFGNGLARIAEVVEPSRDRDAIIELEEALQSDPDFAPFIPSRLETRPDSMRVVLKFQSVDVRIDSRPARRPS